jgi:short-subunit dehydrogenase
MNKSTCVVVGVGPGLGMALVEHFASHGFKIAMLARNEEKLNGYKTRFDDHGYETHPYPVDATDKHRLKETIQKVATNLGSIDVLIFNASILHEALPSELTPDQLEKDLSINVVSGVVAAQSVLPQMKKQTTGTILFTGSAAALSPMPPIISLSITKTAMRFYAMALGKELENTNIYAGTITIKGTMEKGTHFDPNLIAERFWWMYQTKPLNREFIYE